MDFKKTTDLLFANISHDDFARAAHTSVATLRQARLDKTAKAHRSPPPDWEKVALRLAEAQARHFERLAENLRKAMKSN